MKIKRFITKRIIVCVLILSIFCSHISYTASAETLRGDANSSGTVDAVDMVLMKIFLLSGFNYNYIYDVTMDNNVNIIDIVRMKKFLCGYMQKKLCE